MYCMMFVCWFGIMLIRIIMVMILNWMRRCGFLVGMGSFCFSCWFGCGFSCF